MFWAAQSTFEETFNAYTDVSLGGKRTPEPVVENEKQNSRRDSTTETSRPHKTTSKAAPTSATKPKKMHSFAVGKSSGVNK